MLHTSPVTQSAQGLNAKALTSHGASFTCLRVMLCSMQHAVQALSTGVLIPLIQRDGCTATVQADLLSLQGKQLPCCACWCP